ncbi:hypothetical protein ACFORG_18020 [Lutimaribacter marinistellae]|uniref:Sulfatase N-terminal domain-containing protein n=1 Tax=Lutimaribacter marinistellae TaxID=1820329 RepID=A0ABV7TP75_9RHOB
MVVALSTPAFEQEVPQDGSVLPLPPAPFTGVTKEAFEGAPQDYPQPVTPSDGAPKIVTVPIDHLGFGQPRTFGGSVPTSAMIALVNAGLRYTRFHTTAICSPNRAAVLAGRNHH